MHCVGMFGLVVVLATCSLAPSLAFTCETYSSSLGATFDISGLVRSVFTSFFSLIRLWLSSATEPAYMVTDGDIPCTTNVPIHMFMLL